MKEEIKKQVGFDVDFEHAKQLTSGRRQRRQYVQRRPRSRSLIGNGGRRRDHDDLLDHHALDRRTHAQPTEALALAPPIPPQAHPQGDRSSTGSPGRVDAGRDDEHFTAPSSFIKANIKLDGAEKASIADSKKVVEICTKYAQMGMINIFFTVFFCTLSFAFVEPFFFIGYLISIALFGLFQALFMANAGGAWDNAKKVVEVELKMKGTPLHDATIVGDTVGDPFKDTSSVAMNPIIKFTTLFGLLAVEMSNDDKNPIARSKSGNQAAVFFAIALYSDYRSFYRMRINSHESRLPRQVRERPSTPCG